MNRSFINENISEDIVIQLADTMVETGLKGGVTARDLWKHEDLGEFKGQITLSVEPHQCRVVRIQK